MLSRLQGLGSIALHGLDCSLEICIISVSFFICASYERAGELKTGSFGLETPSEAELVRRKRLREEE